MKRTGIGSSIYVQDQSKDQLFGVLTKHSLEGTISEISLETTEVFHSSPKYETRDLRKGNGLGLRRELLVGVVLVYQRPRCCLKGATLWRSHGAMGDERASIVYLAAPDELKTKKKRGSRW